MHDDKIIPRECNDAKRNIFSNAGHLLIFSKRIRIIESV